MVNRQSKRTLVDRDIASVRLRQMLSLLGTHPRGALINSIDESFDTKVFLNPVSWLHINDLKEVHPALSRLDELRKNHHLLGWFSYELAPALEQCLPVRTDYEDSLLEFGVYQHPTEPYSNTPQFRESYYHISELESDTDQDTYVRRVHTILDQIRSGNVYQVNFTVRLSFLFEGDPRALFLSLRRSQPVENAHILRNKGEWIISLSPELFFRIRGDEIEVRPMKGTLKRGRTKDEDGIQRNRLHSSPKDRAENLMIVDLMRNDLGRISNVGTVSVSRLFEVQKLPTLFQMTSTVRAQLRSKVSLYQLLEAVFPSGSVTGTPKLAAMQFIHELERSPRGIYCGALGRFSPKETVFNVPIRTLVLRRLDGDDEVDPNGIYQGELGIGSGIVADSDPLSEWEESKLKSTFLMASPPSFLLVETIRFERGWLRLSRHLARLAASAEYFGFDYKEEDVMRALRGRAASLGAGVFKVRLLLNDRGNALVEAEEVSPIQEPVRVAFASERTNPMDPFLYHKTTHRPLYLKAQQTARRYGFWDLLFRNEDGEITEGSICNIFARIEGDWCTPPQSAGLLPGVMRGELIPKLKAEVRPLRCEDLLAAEEIFVTNSVREVLRAELTDLPHANMQKS